LNYIPPRAARKAIAPETPAGGAVNRIALALDKTGSGERGLANGTNGATGHELTVHDDIPEVDLSYAVNEAGDDRDDIRTGDRVLLIVENDLGFARVLLETARENGFKGLVTSLGATALTLTREFKPHAISLDIYLPDIAGWRVMERLKNDTATRHIPVCIISTDESRTQAMTSGALAFIAKPIQSKDTLDKLLVFLGDYVDRETKNLLVVEPDETRRQQIIDCVGSDDLEIVSAADGPEARAVLNEKPIDCVILGSQSEATAKHFEFAENGPEASFSRLPIIVYGEEQLDGAGQDWKRLGELGTVCRVHSSDRLLDMSTYFLHRDLTRLPEAKRQILFDLHESDRLLENKKVLIVDDDMRNIFALSSVLEEHDMVVLSADNGRDAVRILQTEPDVDIVLMDIMMPEMDGMETMREIRKILRLKNLPIIAVTAKAMKGDREKCIEAGAWDYLSKPVDTEQMLAVLRAWLHR
jgi:CheY-like chemotaxis protein